MTTNPIITAAQSLRTAAATVTDIRVHELGANVSPPGVVVGAPSLAWEGFCPDGAPTSATFPVWVVVAQTDRAMEALWALVPAVVAALDDVPEATVTGAQPGVFPAGGTDLPAYSLTVEVAL